MVDTVYGLIDDNFNESEEEMFNFDVFDSDVSTRIRVNLDGLNMDDIEVGDLFDCDDSGRLDSAHESDLDGQNWLEFNLDNDMSNLKLQEKNPTHWSRSHFSVKSHSDMLVNNLSECFNKVILEARGKPILTMMETIRTNIMLLIVKNKKEADKIKGILGPNIKKKLDVNIKDSLRPVRGPKQRVSVLNMLPTLFPTLRRPLAIPTKQQSTPTQQEVVPTPYQFAPTHLTHKQDAAPREKLRFKRKPTTVRWKSSTKSHL
ncbi:hypothetical protein GOBAR_DD11795 [Gossypium barbadense]|nr:hypothetical protein GOBAR_DD11795 [Gossypium barbadense]